MKVLLIVPETDSHYTVPPLSLGYIAKDLIRNGFEVRILDGIKEKLNEQKMGDTAREFQPDVVGFQVYSCDVPAVNKYLKLLKEEFPNVLRIIGGPHVSGVKEAVFNDLNDADYAFHGEVEAVLPKFLKHYRTGDLHSLKGLIWRDKENVRANPPNIEEDLDAIGMPAWELMNPNSYRGAPQGAVYRNFPIAPILTSRGCPYFCTFCANHITHGRKVRERSVANIIEEIAYLQKEYGVKEIHIIDDNFANRKERVLEFCNEVKKKQLKFTLTFPNGIRLNCLDEEILKALKGIGCYSVIVGIESGSEKILKDMKKSLAPGIIKEKIKLIDSFGIDVTGFFIIGYPTETRETIEQTIKFAKGLKLKRAHFSLFLPLPGTEITEQLIKEGKLKTVNWAGLSYTKVQYVPEGMTEDELKRYQQKAFMEFYLRPKIILGMIKEIRSWEQFKQLAKRAVDYGLAGRAA
ncbi:MAG TPA: radical SAM protein [Nanoarchaeota archaeon]|nr:radical SAM protein [Nanoarchaeota archaeon]